jgi:hypothetical protein
MASSATDTVKDLGRRLVNRAETVVGDDAREVVKRAKHVYRETVTGNTRKPKKKPDPRKYPTRSSNR